MTLIKETSDSEESGTPDSDQVVQGVPNLPGASEKGSEEKGVEKKATKKECRKGS